MSSVTLTCEHAVFTSIRTPMGEGYRIIAASKGVRPDEKQSITRFSPSHGGLCDRAAEPTGLLAGVHGVACYRLPTERTCIAISCPAGAEHTGRGGQRVYTHCVVMEPGDWETIRFNPFHVLRSMVAAGLTQPELKPPNVLPELSLPVDTVVEPVNVNGFCRTIDAAHRAYVLHRLLEVQHSVMNIDADWFAIAEAFMLGIPGPLRAGVSFGAGMRFSVSRAHHLDLLVDDDASIKSKVAGQAVEYIQLREPPSRDLIGGAWVNFVDRLWTSGDAQSLARRTSRPFESTDATSLEQTGQIYNNIDELTERDTNKIIAIASVYLSQVPTASNVELTDELLRCAQRVLQERFALEPWTTVPPEWVTLVALAKTSGKGAGFARPVLADTLRTAMTTQPFRAAEAALDVVEIIGSEPAASVPPVAGATVTTGHANTDRDLPEQILGHLANWAEATPLDDLDYATLSDLRDRWVRVKSDSPSIGRLNKRCESLAAATPPAARAVPYID